jgi:hypothetical protein
MISRTISLLENSGRRIKRKGRRKIVAKKSW